MNNLHIFETTETLHQAAADYIFKVSEENIKAHGKFTIALSGGETPGKLYELLSQEPWASSFDWKNIYVFWGDERCVPMSDQNNNAQMASGALLNKVKIPAENIFPIPVNLSPAQAASVYEQILKNEFQLPLPRFDLILLGLGQNGHTASLFPYTSILQQSTNIVKEVFIIELDMFRVSFTIPLINNAKHILFIVSGDTKASVLKQVCSLPHDPQKYPAQYINPGEGTLLWYIDKDAAKNL